MRLNESCRIDKRVPKLDIEFDEFDAFEGAFDDHEYFNVYRDKLGIQYSLWAIEETVGHMEDPVPSKATKLVYDIHWGEKAAVIPLKEGFTWCDLWKAAEKAIVKSDDLHHVFIEAFYEDGDELVMLTGS